MGKGILLRAELDTRGAEYPPVRCLVLGENAMRLVKQRNENGCGVACVAMIAGVTYSQARALMFGERAGGYTDTAQLREALGALGIQTAPKLVLFKSEAPQDLPFNAILKTNRRTKDWHWVVWDCRRQKVLDPRTPPYRRYRHSSYLEILTP